eukprot:XP_028350813.1 MAGUK p55 subfamily member 7 isoform X4 [Physeter catodon]
MPALSAGSGSDTGSVAEAGLITTAGLYELLAALPAQLQPHVDSQEDLTFLWDVFGEKSLHSLVKIHEKLHYYEEQNPTPVLQAAAALAGDLAEELQNKPLNSEIRELLKLLSKPNVKALLSVHDTVALKNYDPVLPPMPDDIDDEEDSVKIIRLVKNREPLGATIKKDEQTGAIVVARIMRGGAADRSGLIHVGDELREVNGIPVEDKSPEEIIQILAQSQGAITFKIIPSIKEETPSKEGKMFIKALFDYDPNEDKAIPCKEAGLSFKKGDILQIMSQDDATWWQAKHEGDANPRAGLVPSKHFQERRLALRRPEILVQPLKVSNRKSSGFRRSFRLSRKDKKTNKSMYECRKSDQYDTADVPTYEEVTPYRRQMNENYRLVVLVGLFVDCRAYGAPASLLVQLSAREPKPSPVPSPAALYLGSLDLLLLSSPTLPEPPLSSTSPCRVPPSPVAYQLFPQVSSSPEVRYTLR